MRFRVFNILQQQHPHDASITWCIYTCLFWHCFFFLLLCFILSLLPRHITFTLLSWKCSILKTWNCSLFSHQVISHLLTQFYLLTNNFVETRRYEYFFVFFFCIFWCIICSFASHKFLRWHFYCCWNFRYLCQSAKAYDIRGRFFLFLFLIRSLYHCFIVTRF